MSPLRNPTALNVSTAIYRKGNVVFFHELWLLLSLGFVTIRKQVTFSVTSSGSIILCIL